MVSKLGWPDPNTRKCCAGSKKRAKLFSPIIITIKFCHLLFEALIYAMDWIGLDITRQMLNCKSYPLHVMS